MCARNTWRSVFQQNCFGQIVHNRQNGLVCLVTEARGANVDAATLVWHKSVFGGHRPLARVIADGPAHRKASLLLLLTNMTGCAVSFV